MEQQEGRNENGRGQRAAGFSLSPREERTEVKGPCWPGHSRQVDFRRLVEPHGEKTHCWTGLGGTGLFLEGLLISHHCVWLLEDERGEWGLEEARVQCYAGRRSPRTCGAGKVDSGARNRLVEP